MSRYTVLDHNEASRETVLLDAYGKLHLTSWSVARPALGEVMHGPRPALGFQVLSAEESRRDCATHFLLIDCHHSVVLVRWARRNLRLRRRAESS